MTRREAVPIELAREIAAQRDQVLRYSFMNKSEERRRDGLVIEAVLAVMGREAAQRPRHRRQRAGIAEPLQIREARLQMGAVTELRLRERAILEPGDQLVASHPRFSFSRWLSAA